MLILGSMPGEMSLSHGQYYAHPRNGFWPILCQLLGVAPTASYAERCAALVAHRIALWDVIAFCERAGSLDQAIRQQSIVVNDFAAFFATYPEIDRLVFNGGTAEREYRRRVRPALPLKHRGIRCHRLPSTSPAHATLSLDQKLAAWREIRQWLGEPSKKADQNGRSSCASD